MNQKQINEIIFKTAGRSTCKKRKVGALIIMELEDGELEILSSGYNYNPGGTDCEDLTGKTKDIVVHAEMSAITNFNLELPEKRGRENCKYYMLITHPPCENCLKAIKKAGLTYEVVNDFMKFDAVKPRMSLVPASLGQAAARALTYGAKKYKPNNWRKAEEIESYLNAFQRHFDDWREGEENDSDSGLSHLDHLAANLAFIIELQHLPKIKG